MKIRFLKNVAVDVETRAGDVYCTAFNRWQEIRVQEVFPVGKWEKFATIKLENGDLAIAVPIDAYEGIPEKKPEINL